MSEPCEDCGDEGGYYFHGRSLCLSCKFRREDEEEDRRRFQWEMEESRRRLYERMEAEEEYDRELDLIEDQRERARRNYFARVSEDSGNDGCFIATAAYGTPLAVEIQTLRNFRDKCLKKFGLGRKFVSVYYKISPPLAAKIRADKKRRKLVRIFLGPIVRLFRVMGYK